MKRRHESPEPEPSDSDSPSNQSDSSSASGLYFSRDVLKIAHYILSLFAVFYASDRRFMFLKNFEFADYKKNKFYINNVEVHVDIELDKEAVNLSDICVCKSCQERAQTTRLLDIVQSVNWTLYYDLGTLVSHLFAIYCM